MTSGGCYQKARLDQRSRDTEKIYVQELLQELDGPECTSGNYLREGNGSDRFDKYEQHAGRERVVRLIEDILTDPRVTADDTVQTEQSTDADFNKLVCNHTIRTGQLNGCAVQ